MVAIVAGCARAPQPPAAEAASPLPAPAAPATLPADLVRDFADRQRCNLLNGCAPEDRLVALGPTYAAAACALYTSTAPDADRYYRSRLLAALGRLGGPDAVACLRAALRTGRWLDRATAAFALGDLKAGEAVPDLEAVLAAGGGGATLAVEAGARAALAQLGRPVDLAPLWAHLARAAAEGSTPGSLEAVAAWPMLRFVVHAARVVEAHEQAVPIARLLAHPDYYTRREALDALAVLGDAGTVDVVAAALDDPLPGIRRAAATTLAALLPGAGPATPEQWKAWRDRRRAAGASGTAP